MGAMPANAQAIYQFLTAAGLNANAAAGILGNIEQESGGNPASPGGGLIQIHPGNAGYTSNTSLAAQMQSILTYIKANGSISAINAAASSPTAAAIYFQNEYERPAPATENQDNRTSTAVLVAAAAKSGNWSTAENAGNAGAAPSATDTSILGDLSGVTSGISSLAKDFSDVATAAAWLTNKGHWVRIGMFFAGAFLLIAAIYTLVKSPGGGGMPVPIPVPI